MTYISEKYLDEQSDKEVDTWDFPKECRMPTTCRALMEIYANSVPWAMWYELDLWRDRRHRLVMQVVSHVHGTKSQ